MPPARRDDARTALYRVIGRDVMRILADEGGGEGRDPEESGRVKAWWEGASARFDPDLV